MKTVDNFLNFKVGDIATLSDIQTQKEFKDTSVDFKIKDIRKYHEPNDFFTYTAYICEYQAKDEEEPQIIMILLRQVGKDYDLLVYYMDQEGDISEFADLITKEEVEEETEENDEVLDDEEEEETEDDNVTEDLVERFDVTLTFEDDQTSDVTWDKKDSGSTFGVEFSSTDTSNDIKTLAEYFTNDETQGNPHCLIEWTGDSKKGWLEIWYGCEIRPEDLEIFPNG